MTGRRSNSENGSTSLIIDGEQIARGKTNKYLGVEIDENHNNKQHVDTTRTYKTAKITIYNSIIAPHLDYCFSIFHPNEEYLNT
jgi:hypothetical protein